MMTLLEQLKKDTGKLFKIFSLSYITMEIFTLVNIKVGIAHLVNHSGQTLK